MIPRLLHFPKKASILLKIAEAVHVDPKTVAEYFSILEDTLVGFLLQPYHRSIRKRQGSKPKF
jgi:predicted AAA+ superfamily ATPase